MTRSTLSYAAFKSINVRMASLDYYILFLTYLQRETLHSSILTLGMNPNCYLFIFLLYERRLSLMYAYKNFHIGLRATIGRYYYILGVRGKTLFRAINLPILCGSLSLLFQYWEFDTIYSAKFIFLMHYSHLYWQ